MSGYKCMTGMVDNRYVKENHQQGISRVIQRKRMKADVAGHNGKMGMTHAGAHWSRQGDPLVPRKA